MLDDYPTIALRLIDNIGQLEAEQCISPANYSNIERVQ